MTSAKPKTKATKKKPGKATSTKKTAAKKTASKKPAAKKATKPKATPEAKKRARKAAKHAHKNNRNPLRADQMSGELVEFITAIDSYKRIHERPFPSWSEVLVIVKALGYERAG
jgi:predicted flap endonuclease-1-like 5' DNA nuclease